MRVFVDLSGVDAMLGDVDKAVREARMRAGRDAIEHAKEHGDYKNHSFNLRNANGFCIVENGQVVAIEVDNDGVHPDAMECTRNFLLYSDKGSDGLYLSNGMHYAGYVEAKDYRVISDAAELASERIRKYLNI